MKRILPYFLIFSLFAVSLNAQGQISLKASTEYYYNDEYELSPAPAENGVYPVKLTVSTKTADKTLYVKIYRSQTRQGPFTLIIDTMQGNEEYFDLYDSEPAEPGVKYYYIAVLGRQTLENSTPQQKSDVCCGWGALTHEALYVYVNKALNKSYDKMTVMNKPSALGKLGTEETKGNKTGTFKYTAKVKGMGGVASMKYTSYSDDGLLTMTGEMITKSDMFMNGNMDGTLTVTGMYNATIDFSRVIIKDGLAGGGTYSIIPKGTARKEISYTWNTDRPRK
ncbi:MAG: hypothetical protein IK102_08340 [Treponema sp.]|nr:hypothetical protein [Treponema sp.]